jgi:hypothetical protein
LISLRKALEYTRFCLCINPLKSIFCLWWYWGLNSGPWQAVYYFSPMASPLCIGYFWDRILLYASFGLGWNPPICASPSSWDGRHMPLHAVTGWDGGLANLFPGLTLILPISSFQVYEITGLIWLAWKAFLNTH